MTPLRQTLLASALLGLYFLLAVSASLDKCTTYDEIVHLTAGYSYWLYDDYRLQPENGNLPQRWGALPLLFSRPAFPPRDQALWYGSEMWQLGDQFFYHRDNSADAILLQGRVMIALLGVALGVIVFCWACRLFGPLAGLLSLTLYVFCPNLLAHGALATSDMAAALFFLASLASVWWLLHEITWPSVLVSTLALAGLCLSKFSAPIMVPVIGLLAAARVLAGRPLRVRLYGDRTLALRRHQAETIFVVLLAQALMIAVLIWTFYGWRFTAFAEPAGSRAAPFLATRIAGSMAMPQGEGPLATASALFAQRDRFRKDWRDVLDGFDASDLNEYIVWMRDHRLLPEAYLYGFAYTLRTSQARSAFLNGTIETRGWWWFFPYAFLVKTPLGVFLVLALAGLTLRLPTNRPAWGDFGRGFYRTAPLWIFLAVYWSFAVTSHLNIGLRHVLPTYPAMYILAGAAARWLALGRQGERETRRPTGFPHLVTLSPCHLVTLSRFVLLLAVGWVVTESLLIWPNYLAYFNQIVGGPRNGYKHLVDSSLDWGQDLPSLKRWIEKDKKQRGQEPVYLIYFGTGDPAYYGLGDVPRPDRMPTPKKIGDLYRPGTYCISATALQGVYLRSMHPRPLLAYLRQRPPDDMVNYTIMIYRVTAEDLRAVFGEPPGPG